MVSTEERWGTDRLSNHFVRIVQKELFTDMDNIEPEWLVPKVVETKEGKKDLFSSHQLNYLFFVV